MSSASLYQEPFYHFKSEHHFKNLTSAFKSLYDSSDLVDITISVDGGTIKAHRVMLAASSPYFRKVIKSISSSQYPVVFLKDVPYKDLDYLVEFIYKGEVVVDTPSIESFMRTAQVLQIVGLCQDDLGLGDDTKSHFRNSSAMSNFEELLMKRRLLSESFALKRTLKDSPICNEASKKICLTDFISRSPDESLIDIENDDEPNTVSFEEVIPVSPDAVEKKPPRKRCPYCNQMLSVHAIVRHIKDTHNISEKIKCPYCPKLFKNKNSLGCHTWRFHKEGSANTNGPLGTTITDQPQLTKDD